MTSPTSPDSEAREGEAARPTPWYGSMRMLVALGVVVLVAVVAAAVALGGDDDSDGGPTDVVAGDDADASADGSGTPTDEAGASTDGASSASDGSRDAPHPLGQVADVGTDFEVAFLEFTPDAAEELRPENEIYDPAPDGETHAMLRVRATYHGEGESTVPWDLAIGYMGEDGEVYTNASCVALEPESLSIDPQISAGESLEGNTCIEMPRRALDGGAVFVEAMFGPDTSTVWWSVD